MGEGRGLCPSEMSRLYLECLSWEVDSQENNAILKDWEVLVHRGFMKKMGAIWPSSEETHGDFTEVTCEFSEWNRVLMCVTLWPQGCG